MTLEAPQMYCKHCWNPVEKIQYREDGKIIGGGDIQNVWKHGKIVSPPPCSKNPIMDEDVVSEEELP